MKLSVRYRGVFTFACVFALPLFTQAQQTPYVTGSTVTGTVLCGDSGAPARFAKVVLKPVEPSHSGEDFMNSLLNNIQKIAAQQGDGASPAAPPTEDKRKAMAVASKGMNEVMDMMGATTVGLDGRFSFAGVKPGTYYVHAIYEGYLDPFSQLSDEDFSSTDPAIRARLAQIPTVTVTGSDSAHADVRLERGAAITGRIVYDDGSPASGWTVAVVNRKDLDKTSETAAALMNPALAMSGAATLFKTDDLGRYRISGIAAGEYVVSAVLTATPIGINAANIGDGGGQIALTVYSGDTFSRGAAKSIVVTAGEERGGVDITIPARSLHSIVGHVYAKSDGHTLNIGLVKLTGKDNPAIERTAAIRDDGSFHFEYLPGDSNYAIKVVEAEEGKILPAANNIMGMNIPKQEVERKYGTDATEVKLRSSDIDSVRLTVAQTDWTPAAEKPGEGDISPADLLKGMLDAMPNGADASEATPKP